MPIKVDPESLGPIRNIVRSAHKWGGDGKEPDFDKIKRVLMSRHPDVIAKAFGGNPNVAAAWIKDQWYAVNRPGKQWRGKPDKTPGFSLAPWYTGAPEGLEAAEDDETVELWCTDVAATEDDGLVWKTICRTGTWRRSPLPGGKPLRIDKPLFDDVETAFKDGAWENVTVPLSHRDRVDENTGFVRQIKQVPDPERPGEYKLLGGIEFTEPEIREKALRGTIANCSVGISMKGHQRTSDGKFYPRVLKHVALTNAPWLDGLDPFGKPLTASLTGEGAYELDADPDEALTELSVLDGEVEDVYLSANADGYADVFGYELAKPENRDDLPTTAFAIPETRSFPIHTLEFAKRALKALGRAKPEDRDRVKRAVYKRYPQLKDAHASHEESTRDEDRIVLTISAGDQTTATGGGEHMADDTLTMSQEELQAAIKAEAEKIATAALAARDEAWEARFSQVDSERQELRVSAMERDWQAAGHAAALVKKAGEYLRASQSSDTIVKLSQEDGTEEELSLSDVIEGLMAAIPPAALTKDQPRLGGQSLNASSDDGRPALELSDDEIEKRTDDLYKDLTTGPALSI